MFSTISVLLETLMIGASMKLLLLILLVGLAIVNHYSDSESGGMMP